MLNEESYREQRSVQQAERLEAKAESYYDHNSGE